MHFGNYRTASFEKYRDMDKEFQEVTIINAPVDFISFPNNDGVVKGRLVDTSKLVDGIHFGNGSGSGDEVAFDRDDVIVYDKNGIVYYAKGFLHGDKYYYTATVTKPASEYGH